MWQILFRFSYLRSPCLLIDLIVPSSWYTPSPSNSILIMLSPGTRDAKSAPWIPELKQWSKLVKQKSKLALKIDPFTPYYLNSGQQSIKTSPIFICTSFRMSFWKTRNNTNVLSRSTTYAKPMPYSIKPWKLRQSWIRQPVALINSRVLRIFQKTKSSSRSHTHV